VLLVDFSTATQLADLSNALLGKITEVLGKRWQDYASALMKSLSLQLETEVDGATGNIRVRLKPSARKAPMEEQRSTFMGILNQANTLAREKGTHLGIVIDEFQELARFEEEATLWNLRGEIQHHAHISYVFTGSRVHMIRMLISSDRAFYKMFGVVNFDPIPEKEMAAWIVAKLEHAGVDPGEAVGALLEVAETCTVDRLRMAALCYTMAQGNGLTEDMATKAREAIVEEDRAYFQSDWQQMTAHQQNVLRALAEGERRLTSEGARERFSLPASGSVTNTLRSLLERGILYELEEAPGYAFDNPFFKHWIRMRNAIDLGLGYRD
jgi:hypothetical protein